MTVDPALPVLSAFLGILFHSFAMLDNFVFWEQNQKIVLWEHTTRLQVRIASSGVVRALLVLFARKQEYHLLLIGLAQLDNFVCLTLLFHFLVPEDHSEINWGVWSSVIVLCVLLGANVLSAQSPMRFVLKVFTVLEDQPTEQFVLRLSFARAIPVLQPLALIPITVPNSLRCQNLVSWAHIALHRALLRFLVRWALKGGP